MHLDLLDPYSDDAGSVWRTLESAAPTSYFLSWPWVENWLACVPRRAAPHLAVVSDTSGPRAAFVLGRRFHVRNRIVPTRAMFLNATGNTCFDSVCIEYNGLVGSDLPLDHLIDVLPSDWDELYMPGIDEAALGGVLTSRETSAYHVRIDKRVPVYYVPLDHVRASDYASLLSAQTRRQLRRAQRDAGEATVEVATRIDHALDIYDELCALHNASWQAKGFPGAFSNRWFAGLHRRLIERRLLHGDIQLVRVRSTAGTIGCLYNFVHGGRVLQYQSGFARFSDPHMKPGFVCHCAAIEHSAAAGLAAYDFLAGAARYKRSLSTDVGSLSWVRVQRPRFRFAVEEKLRRLRSFVRGTQPARAAA